jgi:general secretion pathway protein H
VKFAAHSPTGSRRQQQHTATGFTLIELLVVVALIAIASGLATFALRDPSASQLENEAARLAALFESARAQSRSTGIAVRWLPHGASQAEGNNTNALTDAPAPGFQFVGLGPHHDLPGQWLGSGVSAEIVGKKSLLLGPEPMIGAQQVVLRLNDQQLVLGTDGLGPFEVNDTANSTPTRAGT